MDIIRQNKKLGGKSMQTVNDSEIIEDKQIDMEKDTGDTNSAIIFDEGNQEVDERITRICETTKDRLKEIMRYFDDSYFKLADAIGISYQSLSKKLNNHVDFKRSEILKIKYRYNLDAEQIDYIFFSEG